MIWGIIEIGILLRDKMVCQISVEVEYHSSARNFCYKYSSWFYVQMVAGKKLFNKIIIITNWYFVGHVEGLFSVTQVSPMLFVEYYLCKILTFPNQTLNNTILWRDKQSVVNNAVMYELWVKAIADAVFKISGNVFSIVGPINDANLNLHYA